MAINTFDIQRGMEVFGSDGQKIGNVDEVYSNTDATGTETGAEATSTADEDSSTSADNGGIGLAQNLTVGLFASDDEREPAVDVTRDPGDLQEEYGTSATATSTPDDGSYFTVSEGGFLGLGAKQLYIPFSAVDTVAGGNVVTLSYTKEDVADRFTQQPDGYSDSDDDATDTP
jgi:hypothetical protein